MQDYRRARLRQACATYPQLIGRNDQLTERINRLIQKKVQTTLPTGRYQEMNIISAASQYDVTVNRNEVLSLRFENYYYPEKMANGITIVQALTVNLITGKKYNMEDLFNPQINYKKYLNDIIKKQISENELPLIKDFPGINGNEVFYLTEDSLVIIYQEYELTPGYYGPLVFKISYHELSPIINQNGPIAMLIN